MKRILVPCDFSAPSEEAFKLAVHIVKESKGEIHVLHVIDLTFLGGKPTLANNYAFNMNFLKSMEKEADDKFHTMWEKYAPLTLPVKFSHKLGSVAPDVLTHISEHNTDLVIMGTHGAGAAHWGSNTEKIIRNSPVPVIALRKMPEKGIRKIAFPVVPNHHATGVMEQVKRMQEFFHSTLHLLWVNTPLILLPDAEATEKLSQLATQQNLKDYTVNIRSDFSVSDGVLQFGADIGADMIAMGTHGWKGLSHLFIGSAAEDVVRKTHIPIWTTALD